MKERPILFSGPMVRAILDGRKTQTRRVVKPQPDDHPWQLMEEYKLIKTVPIECQDGMACISFHHTIPQNEHYDEAARSFCPYGAPGGRLWVRETWMTYPKPITSKLLRDGADTWPMVDDEPVAYAADQDGQLLNLGWIKKPSIHMPRRFSRINLEVINVWVERVKDISPHNALAEGIRQISKDACVTWKYGVSDNDGYPGQDNHGWPWMDWCLSPVEAFQKLWDSINGKKYPWSSNPWVWVIEFKRI